MRQRKCRHCGGLNPEESGYYKPVTFFREAVGTGLVRIGTAKLVAKHLREDAGCPHPLRLLGVCKKPADHLRNMFHRDRIRLYNGVTTDWFHLTDKIREYIAANCTLPTWAIKQNAWLDTWLACRDSVDELAKVARPLSLAEETFLASGDEWSCIDGEYVPYAGPPEPPKPPSRWPGKL